MSRSLSDINLEEDGFTQDDVIKNRLDMKDEIRRGAVRGNVLCLMCENMDALASQYGIDATYDESMDELDY